MGMEQISSLLQVEHLNFWIYFVQNGRVVKYNDPKNLYLTETLSFLNSLRNKLGQGLSWLRNMTGNYE